MFIRNFWRDSTPVPSATIDERLSYLACIQHGKANAQRSVSSGECVARGELLAIKSVQDI